MIARHAAAQARIARIDRDVACGVVPALVDSFGRKHDYLRISLSERCNQRSEGVPLSPSSSILTNAEVVRLVRIFVRHGVTKLCLTGRELTFRHGLTELIQELRELAVKQVGMTGNGIAICRKLPELGRNGLTHLNLRAVDEDVRDKRPDGHIGRAEGAEERPRLFDKKETSLRDLLRSDSPAAEQKLKAAVRGAVGGKLAKRGVPNNSFSGPEDENNEGRRRAGAEPPNTSPGEQGVIFPPTFEIHEFETAP
ncbi:hypothetical protein FRC06_002701 [Ceratobasidium sp. 370]|nr:hypothetical protein FRC06_002701 [Ceratobasidium sp. 370]